MIRRIKPLSVYLRDHAVSSLAASLIVLIFMWIPQLPAHITSGLDAASLKLLWSTFYIIFISIFIMALPLTLGFVIHTRHNGQIPSTRTHALVSAVFAVSVIGIMYLSGSPAKLMKWESLLVIVIFCVSGILGGYCFARLRRSPDVSKTEL